MSLACAMLYVHVMESLESYQGVVIATCISRKGNRLGGVRPRSAGSLLRGRERIEPRFVLPQSHGIRSLGLLRAFLEQSLGWVGGWKERGKEEERRKVDRLLVGFVK